MTAMAASLMFAKKPEAPLFHSVVGPPLDGAGSEDSQNFLGAFNGMYDSAGSIAREGAVSLEEDNPFQPATVPHRAFEDDDSSRGSLEGEMPGGLGENKDRTETVRRTIRVDGPRQTKKELARDAPWLAVYGGCVTVTLLIAIWVYCFANSPLPLPSLSPSRGAIRETPVLPTTTLVPTSTMNHFPYPTDDAEPWPTHPNGQTEHHDSPILDIADPPLNDRKLRERRQIAKVPTENETDDEVEEALSLLAILPMLTSITLCSIFATMGALFLLSYAVRRAVYALLIVGPASLIAVAFWGFGASFATALQDNAADNYGTEARWACFIAIVIAGLSARMIYTRLNRLEKTVQVVELATTALIAHPALLLVQGALLLSHLVVTLPFFGLFIRLLLSHPTNPDRPVLVMSIFVLLTYLWTLSLFRNMSRLTAAIVLSNWYFTRHEPSPLFRTSRELVAAAWEKACGPQLGTVALASLLITTVNLSTFILVRAKRWLKSSNGLLPPFLSFLYYLSPLAIFLAGLVESISQYALIWSGITGEGFWPSAAKVGQLVRANGMSRTADYLLVKLILTLLTLSFSILAGLLGLLTVSSSTFTWPTSTSAHHLYHHAFSIILSFSIPYYAVRLSSDLLSNSIDCLFICFTVDVEKNTNHCTKALEAFTTAKLEDEESDSPV